MKMHPLYPLTFHPIYKDTFWGGSAIAEHFNRPHTPIPCAEAWELSALESDPSIIANGAFEGYSLPELVHAFGRDLIGTKAKDPEVFPLLFKLVDVQTRCSVQVHPDETTAQQIGVRAKHELWYILKTFSDAGIWAGVPSNIHSLEGITAHLNHYQTHEGDVFDIPPGLIHAIGGGNLLFEVQQTSNAAFRIDDWGNGRETHHEAALKAIHWEATPGIYHEPSTTSRELRPRITTPHFTFATLDLRRERSLHTTETSFMVLFCTTGKATLEHHSPHSLTLLPGDLVLIPPRQYVTLHPLAEKTRLLITML